MTNACSICTRRHASACKSCNKQDQAIAIGCKIIHLCHQSVTKSCNCAPHCHAAACISRTRWQPSNTYVDYHQSSQICILSSSTCLFEKRKNEIFYCSAWCPQLRSKRHAHWTVHSSKAVSTAKLLQGISSVTKHCHHLLPAAKVVWLSILGYSGHRLIPEKHSLLSYKSAIQIPDCLVTASSAAIHEPQDDLTVVCFTICVPTTGKEVCSRPADSEQISSIHLTCCTPLADCATSLLQADPFLFQ